MSNGYFKISCNGVLYSENTYRSLIETRIKKLTENQIEPNSHSIIECETNFESILWMVACYEYSCSFTIISPTGPKDRNSMIRSDCKPQQILGDGLSVTKTMAPMNKIQGEKIVYMLYTSGTTGVPKGVIVTQTNYDSFFHGISEYIDFNKKNTFLSCSALTFDISILETLIALSNDQSIVIMENKDKVRPNNYLELIEKNRVSIVQWTPTLLEWILKYSDFERYRLSSVEKVLLGGEKAKKNDLLALLKYFSCEILLCYGPTETTIWSMIHRFNLNDKHIYLGKPLKGYFIKLIKSVNSCYSELVILGNGVSPGYLNKLSDNFYIESGNMNFRTGDRVQELPNRNLIFTGRTDRQIKIKGFRVELDEVEAVFENYKLVHKAFIINDSINGKNVLKAFILFKIDIDLEELIRHLKLLLPEYSIPKFFYGITTIPRNINGKADYQKINSLYGHERYLLK